MNGTKNWPPSRRLFDRVGRGHGIEPRLTKVTPPWTNGQAQRVNRTHKQATVRKYHYGTPQQLKEHFYTLPQRLQLRQTTQNPPGLTPYEAILQRWQKEPDRSTINPHQHTLGLNS